MKSIPVALGWLLGWGCFLGVIALAVEEGDENDESQRARHLMRMKELAASIRLWADAKQPASESKLTAEPVLRYSDSTRTNNEASLWIWSAGGRPSAVLAVELYPTPPRGPRWLFEIASLSTTPIKATREGAFDWTAKEPGLKFAVIEEEAPQADTPARRLAHLRRIFRTFTAHEKTATEGRIELRPLATPLHRYADVEAGVADGAIFAFANGTNPEVLLVLEAPAKKDDRWRYALAQMRGAEVSVELAGREVWNCTEADPPAVRGSYSNYWIAAQEEAE